MRGASAQKPEPPFSPIDEVLQDLRDGKMVILLDDEDRENEGDLICAAEKISPEMVNFMLRYGRGTLCVPLTRARCEQLQFGPQVASNTTVFGTAFTVAVDAGPQFGVRTGVSALDRCTTIRRMVEEAARAEDFARPGHVNPLIARDGGTLVRAGQTEGTVDLCRLAGLMPAGVLIEILNEDGTMARLPELARFGAEHGIKLCTVAAIIEYRMQRERIVERTAEAPIRNGLGEWRMIVYRSYADNGQHVALCHGDVGARDESGAVIASDEPTLVRVHSECLSGDVFGSMRCECGQQLDAALAAIAAAGRGVLVYLRQEGRGIGLEAKLKAYALQDQGLDTVDANVQLGLPVDRRDYGVGAQILRDLGLSRVRILTNNPKKINRLEVYGLEITEQAPLEIAPNEVNRRYLEAKKHRLGHLLREV